MILPLPPRPEEPPRKSLPRTCYNNSISQVVAKDFAAERLKPGLIETYHNSVLSLPPLHDLEKERRYVRVAFRGQDHWVSGWPGS